MEEKVRGYIEQFNMIGQGDVVAAGVSGGADSVCLLLLLAAMRRDIGFSLTVIHVEHGIRGEESLNDAAFTEQLCRNLDVPFELCSVDVPRYRDENGLSTEEAARELRYKCFLETCERIGADKIALAHHAGDCAETLLFRLARGTGIRGMSGIRPVSEQFFYGGRFRENVAGESLGGAADGGKESTGRLILIRPLLCVTRAEIEEWLAGHSQTYCTDSTNADAAYARNRIRERVMPELEEINPQAVPHMQSLAGQIAEICDYLDEAAWEAGRGAYSVGTGDGKFIGAGAYELSEGQVRAGAALDVNVSCEKFTALHPALQKHLMLQLIGMAAGSKKDITSLHVERVLELMRSGVGTKVSLPHLVTAEKTYDSVMLWTNRTAANDVVGCGASRGICGKDPVNSGESGDIPLGTELRIPGETAVADGLIFSAEVFPNTFSKKIPRKSYTKWFDYDKIKTAVRLRTRHSGDYIQADADGGRKKLRKFFIDEKVPASERDRIWLLADGDHIMWVVGYRISEAYKVTGQTRRILCVSIKEVTVKEDTLIYTGKGEDTDG